MWRVDKNSDSVSRDKLFLSGALRNTIIRNYPAYKEALEMLSKKMVTSVAFSARFWVDKERNLHYKNFPEPIGKLEHDLPVLGDKYMFLAEALDEDM